MTELVARGRNWAAPHLGAGRGYVSLAVVGVFILIGACTDTIAFKSVLDELLNQPQAESWLMACGATALALVAAGTAGVAVTTARREGSRGARVVAVVLLLIWLLLGIALFVVRWHISDTTDTSTVDQVTSSFGGSGSAIGSGQSDTTADGHYAAFFFGSLYLISGICTLFEVERLYNPEFLAYQRAGRDLRRQQRVVQHVGGLKSRADSTVQSCTADFDNEEARRRSAIAERQALGSELANYARVLMAQALADPATTNLTQTGPLPRVLDDEEPPEAGDPGQRRPS